MILCGGTGSLQNKETRDFYKRASEDWKTVYTLLRRGEDKIYKLPSNVFPLNETYQVFECGLKIGNCTNVPIDISVSSLPSRARINIMNRGAFEYQQNGITILANDASCSWFDESRTFEVERME